MNSHVRRFYRKFIDEDAPIRLYHEVIALHEAPRFSWEEISSKVPSLPKGWHELAYLQKQDRIEFSRDFWLSTVPFEPRFHEFFNQFFSALDDVGVYVTQLRFDSPFESEIVYSLRDGSCFFHGSPPCSDEEIAKLKQDFDGLIPEDFCAFLKIHDGFSKHTDTGLVKTKFLKALYDQLIVELREDRQDIVCKGKIIDPKSLIPFYESFGQPSYQCFFTEWHPGKEVGNVYYSTLEKVISDHTDRNASMENLAFPSFLDWLVFYLESIEF
ncbi:MAG: SMI1/KNR4 family protein [Parachlamydiales bacterium]|nr:SMI1/KNR4 family protein [Verrucomicrobiota bacterium]MBX3719097.1 SMI1/KNR4 family protein [Candidatus Acheromyda pituitae]